MFLGKSLLSRDVSALSFLSFFILESVLNLCHFYLSVTLSQCFRSCHLGVRRGARCQISGRTPGGALPNFNPLPFRNHCRLERNFFTKVCVLVHSVHHIWPYAGGALPNFIPYAGEDFEVCHGGSGGHKGAILGGSMGAFFGYRIIFNPL